MPKIKSIRKSQELYKMYRPEKFSEVYGNESAKASLQAMLKTGTVPHTILIHGPSGTGKTTIARILRKRLDCHDTDYYELNCSSSRGIDTIREIGSSMRLAPWGGKTRVWVLDEVHQLTTTAQHSTLKILEDTPDHVYFILCTTDPKRLLKTIHNRSTVLTTAPLRDEEMEELVQSICKRASLKIPGDTISDIVDKSQGSARRALVLLDKIRNVDGRHMQDALDDIGKESSMAIDLCRAIFRKRHWKEVAGILRDLKKENVDQEQVRMAVLGYARAILVSGRADSRAFSVLCAFEDGFGDNISAGLTRACYEVVNGT